MSKVDTQIQKVDLSQIQAIGEFGLPELLTMKETLCKKLTIPQFNLFMYQMNRMKLDPSLKHAFAIPYGDTIDIRVSYEGYHAKAQESEGYEGVFTQVICDNETDDFEAETDEEGLITSIKHKIKFPRGKAVGAYAIAKRSGKKNVIVLMDAAEVGKWVKKNPNFWKLDDGTIDPDMFKKHVGIRAIKAQYDIAAVVEEGMETMNAVSAATSYDPLARKDITDEATENNRSEPEVITAGGKQSLNGGDKPDEAAKLKQAREEMKKKLSQLGITEPEDIAAYISSNVKIKGDKPTLAELIGLNKTMDLQIAEMQAAQAHDDDLPE